MEQAVPAMIQHRLRRRDHPEAVRMKTPSEYCFHYVRNMSCAVFVYYYRAVYVPSSSSLQRICLGRACNGKVFSMKLFFHILSCCTLFYLINPSASWYTRTDPSTLISKVLLGSLMTSILLTYSNHCNLFQQIFQALHHPTLTVPLISSFLI